MHIFFRSDISISFIYFLDDTYERLLIITSKVFHFNIKMKNKYINRNTYQKLSLSTLLSNTLGLYNTSILIHWVINNGMPYLLNNLVYIAIICKHETAFYIAINIYKLPLTSYIFDNLSKNKTPDILQWAYDRDCPVCYTASLYAVSTGRLDNIIWMIENNIDISDESIMVALKYKQYHIFDWLYDWFYVYKN